MIEIWTRVLVVEMEISGQVSGHFMEVEFMGLADGVHGEGMKRERERESNTELKRTFFPEQRNGPWGSF